MKTTKNHIKMKNLIQLIFLCFIVAIMAFASTAASHYRVGPSKIDTLLMIEKEEPLQLEAWMLEFETTNLKNQNDV